MTGAVDWQTLIWVVGLVFTAGAMVAGFLLWLWSVVRGLRADWEKELGERDLKIEAANARAKVIQDVLNRDMTNYKQHAGETFATKAGMTGALERVESAVTRLSSQMEGAVDRLSTRIDRLLEVRHEPPENRR